MPPSGQSSLRSIFNAIIHMRQTTYALQNTHTIETKPHTHTHMPPSGQSSLRPIFNAIIHMRHTTYSLQNTHAKYTRNRHKATHTTTTVRSIFSQIFNAVVHMCHTTYFLQSADGIDTSHAHHREVNLVSDLERNHSHALHDLLPAKYTRNRIEAAHTTTVRSIFTQIFCGIIRMRTTYILENTDAI